MLEACQCRAAPPYAVVRVREEAPLTDIRIDDPGERARRRTERARGLMLGLLLGDSVDEWHTNPGQIPGPMHGSCLSQLACFTLEGLIRAHERAIHRGICSVEGTIWHAWCRWAHIQGLGSQFAQRWNGGNQAAGWPDGWLHQVRPLSVRRGSAPATVTALRASPHVPADDAIADGNSAGHHALTRVLPLAVLADELGDAARVAVELARFSHGSPSAAEAAATGVRIAAEAVGRLPADQAQQPSEAGSELPGTAAHALWHGWQAAAGARDFAAAVTEARRAGRGPAIVAGALYGARHGTAAFQEQLVARHEIAWVGDQLARDAIRDVSELPAGTEDVAASDPAWSARYPGW